MQGGIVCVMILGRDGTHGKGRGAPDASTLPVLFIGLITYIMAARIMRIFAIKAGDLLDLVKIESFNELYHYTLE